MRRRTRAWTGGGLGAALPVLNLDLWFPADTVWRRFIPHRGTAHGQTADRQRAPGPGLGRVSSAAEPELYRTSAEHLSARRCACGTSTEACMIEGHLHVRPYFCGSDRPATGALSLRFSRRAGRQSNILVRWRGPQRSSTIA